MERSQKHGNVGSETFYANVMLVLMRRHLDKGVKKQVKYYKNYLRSPSQSIRLFGVVGSTDIDGRRDLHAQLVSAIPTASLTSPRNHSKNVPDSGRSHET